MEAQTGILEKEAGFRALFRYASVGILVIGRHGRIELANPHTEKLFGYRSTELFGKPIETLLPEPTRQKHNAQREPYFKRLLARPMGKGMELSAKKKNGDLFPVEISLGYYEHKGDPVAVAFISDISQRKQALEALQKLNEELEARVVKRNLELTHALEREKELNEIKSRFVAMASHEFRTPLSTILSSTTLLEKYTVPDDADKRKKHFDRIKSSVRNLTEILEDFLSLEKLEHNKIDLVVEPFDLPSLAENMRSAVEGILKPGQRISYTHTGGNRVISDRRVLCNTLNNLLSNAIKYSLENGTVSLSSEVSETHVLITVQDNGIGIPAEDQEHIFSMFYRARNAYGIQGTGLGLNIVKRYMELLNGTIRFKSVLNQGTTFSIEFPRVLRNAAEQ